MTLEELRNQIDALDRQLVELLSERARAALMIGHLKVATSLPVYEPAREKVIYANVRAANKGPLPDIELIHIYERIIDVMRALQRNELASERNALASTAGPPAGLHHGSDELGSPAMSPRRRGGESSGEGTGAESPETGNRK
jgi:chorismate mutase